MVVADRGGGERGAGVPGAARAASSRDKSGSDTLGQTVIAPRAGFPWGRLALASLGAAALLMARRWAAERAAQRVRLAPLRRDDAP